MSRICRGIVRDALRDKGLLNSTSAVPIDQSKRRNAPSCVCIIRPLGIQEVMSSAYSIEHLLVGL